MTTLTVLAALAVAFLAVAWTCEWVTARVREPGPYRDTSRGTGRLG